MDVNLVQLGWGNYGQDTGSVADVMVFLADRIVGKNIPDRPYPEGPGQDPVALNLIEKIRSEANEAFGFVADYDVPGHPIRRYVKDVDVFQVGGPMTKEWKERNSVDGISYDHLMDPQYAAGKRPWDEDWYDWPDGDTNPNPHTNDSRSNQGHNNPAISHFQLLLDLVFSKTQNGGLEDAPGLNNGTSFPGPPIRHWVFIKVWVFVPRTFTFW